MIFVYIRWLLFLFVEIRLYLLIRVHTFPYVVVCWCMHKGNYRARGRRRCQSDPTLNLGVAVGGSKSAHSHISCPPWVLAIHLGPLGTWRCKAILGRAAIWRSAQEGPGTSKWLKKCPQDILKTIQTPSMILKYTQKYTRSVPRSIPKRAKEGPGAIPDIFRTLFGPARAVLVCWYLLILKLVHIYSYVVIFV